MLTRVWTVAVDGFARHLGTRIRRAWGLIGGRVGRSAWAGKKEIQDELPMFGAGRTNMSTTHHYRSQIIPHPLWYLGSLKYPILLPSVWDRLTDGAFSLYFTINKRVFFEKIWLGVLIILTQLKQYIEVPTEIISLLSSLEGWTRNQSFNLHALGLKILLLPNLKLGSKHHLFKSLQIISSFSSMSHSLYPRFSWEALFGGFWSTDGWYLTGPGGIYKRPRITIVVRKR